MPYNPTSVIIEEKFEPLFNRKYKRRRGSFPNTSNTGNRARYSGVRSSPIGNVHDDENT